MMRTNTISSCNNAASIAGREEAEGTLGEYLAVWDDI